MLYNFSNNKFSKLIKLAIFWGSLSVIILVFAILIKYEIKPRQREVEINIDIKNKINICIPEEKVETL